MHYRILADAVMFVHFGFILFVAAGSADMAVAASGVGSTYRHWRGLLARDRAKASGPSTPTARLLRAHKRTDGSWRDDGSRRVRPGRTVPTMHRLTSG